MSIVVPVAPVLSSFADLFFLVRVIFPANLFLRSSPREGFALVNVRMICKSTAVFCCCLCRGLFTENLILYSLEYFNLRIYQRTDRFVCPVLQWHTRITTTLDKLKLSQVKRTWCVVYGGIYYIAFGLWGDATNISCFYFAVDNQVYMLLFVSGTIFISSALGTQRLFNTADTSQARTLNIKGVQIHINEGHMRAGTRRYIPTPPTSRAV